MQSQPALVVIGAVFEKLGIRSERVGMAMRSLPVEQPVEPADTTNDLSVLEPADRE